MNKIFESAGKAVKDIVSGASIMSSGFGLCGNPDNLIAALNKLGVKDLTIISNNCGTTEHGLSILLRDRQISKMISSYVGENKIFEQQFINGELEVELTPQGTLAEKIRAGGAGIPAFYTPTGVGTQVSEGGLPMVYNSDGSVKKASEAKETKIFNNKTYCLEEALRADFAIIKAYKADTYGNLIFRKTARNFAPMMATAAKTTIVEAEHIVEEGQLEPDSVHLPGIYVRRIIQGQNYRNLIEHKTLRDS